jgi:hypothetical protein
VSQIVGGQAFVEPGLPHPASLHFAAGADGLSTMLRAHPDIAFIAIFGAKYRWCHGAKATEFGFMDGPEYPAVITSLH